MQNIIKYRRYHHHLVTESKRMYRLQKLGQFKYKRYKLWLKFFQKNKSMHKLLLRHVFKPLFLTYKKKIKKLRLKKKIVFNKNKVKTLPIASSIVYTPFRAALSLKSPFTHAVFLTKKQRYVYMPTRTMFSRVSKIVRNSNRYYATWNSYGAPKINPNDPKCDPKALSNNDKNHTEIVKGKCSKDGCNDKICQAPCAEDHKQKVEGHFTHGKHETEDKKNINLKKNEDYSGNLKDQNAIVYREGHDPHPDSVKNEQATEFLHKDGGAAIKTFQDELNKLQKKK